MAADRNVFKPWAILTCCGYAVELVSYPFEENGVEVVNARLEPGDPTSMETLQVADFDPLDDAVDSDGYEEEV